MKIIHHKSVQNYLQNRSPNPVIQQIIQIHPAINDNEETLSRKTRRSLAQLRANESPFLIAYMNKINLNSHPDPIYPLCKNQNHDTRHLFSCTSINTNLRPGDLWNDPVAVADLFQQWRDALGAAGGGLGGSSDVRSS